MRPMLMLMALLAGALMPVQAGVNAKLRVFLGDAVLASLVSFAVGTVVLLGYVVVTRTPWPAAGAVAAAPWWTWTGGALGAFFVAVSVLLAYKLGAAGMVTWIIAGQLVGSLLLDQAGAVGFAVRAVTWQRLVGVGLLFAGAMLVNRY